MVEFSRWFAETLEAQVPDPNTDLGTLEVTVATAGAAPLMAT
jgi:hypothetical protein